MLELHECENRLCRKTFARKQFRSQRFCCKDCRIEFYKNSKNYEEKICIYCSSKFTTTIASKKYCSIECKKLYEKEHYDNSKQVIEKKCLHCKEVFIDVPKKKYCSKECATNQKRINDERRYHESKRKNNRS